MEDCSNLSLFKKIVLPISKFFVNSGPSAANLKVFHNHKNIFFLTLGQNNFNTKYNLIMQLHIFLAPLWLLPTRIAYLNWKLQSFSAITKPLKLCTHCCFSGWFISFFHVNYVDKYIHFPFFQKRNQHFLYFMFIGSVVEKDGGIGLLKTLWVFLGF